MLKKFDQHLIKNFPFLKTNSFYIAVSGGIDSMVLVNLFQHYQLSFGLLHCNFKLRGEESDADMRFIHDYATENKLQLKIGFFETKEIANKMKVSIQVAARALRYNWFKEQMIENNVPYVATAHHLDDNLETFIINLSRGTGLDGLTGIPVINDKILRPLLPFSRAEIEQYAKENNIKWREDSSNESDKYLRNKIRHHVIPALKEISPNFLESFQKTQKYLNQAQSIVADGEYIFYKEVATENEKGTIQFDLRKLLQIPNYEAYIYCWFKDFGFTAWDDIYKLVHAQSGKQVFSEKYQILKNRNYLLLSTRDFNKEPVEYLIEEGQKEVKFPLNITISEVNSIIDVATNCIFVDRKKLQFPLKLRKWEEGDYFYPYGMKGKKMLSKFFKDEKMSLIDKAQQWVLCSENLIVWVCNKRFDDRFKVTPNTTTILKITIL